MKIAKTVRAITTVALLTMTAVSIYSSVKAKDMYREMKASCNELKGRISDMRSTIKTLSDQLEALKERSEHKDTLCSEKENERDTCQEAIKVKEIYTVREYNGIVGIFDENGNLIREENIMVSTLSPSDRQNLEIGIRVSSGNELENLIETLK